MNGSLRALLSGLIDYAGLFPPAALSMADAVANYAAYRGGADAWALARFMVPVMRLAEFEAVVAPHLHGEPWRLSVLAQATDADTLHAFNARHAGRARIEAVETAVATADAIDTLSAFAPIGEVFVELSIGDDPAPFVEMLAAQRLRAKVRTGGVTPQSFPSTAQVARFLATCAHHGVSFKATAGLHHPMRGEYPLTYDSGAERGTMFGFLNLFAAAAYSQSGMSTRDLERVLEERVTDAFRFTNDAASWRGHMLSVAELTAVRTNFALSFGSCSFREPLDDLSALDLT